MVPIVFVFLLVVFVLFLMVQFKGTLSVRGIVTKPGGQSLHFRVASEELLYCQT